MLANITAQLSQQNVWILLILVLWVLPWKGVALWKSARLGQTKWFIALLVINTLGILEIIYIFLVAKKKESLIEGDDKADENEESNNSGANGGPLDDEGCSGDCAGCGE
jgi:hypothetical protein